MESELRPDDAPCTVARHGDVVLLDIASAIKPLHVDQVDALTAEVGGPRANSVGVLVRVAEGVAMPTLETRARFVSYLIAHRGRVRSIHVALEGHGFWAATMSALAATVARAVPHGPPIHVYDRLERAASELEAKMIGVGAASSAGVDLVRALRRAS